MTSVTCDYFDIFQFYIQHIRHDLGIDRKVPLPLCAVTGHHGHFSIGAHGNFAAFVRTNRCTFSKCHHSNPQPFAFSAGFGLNFFAEFFVIDHIQAEFHIAQVISTVEHTLHKVLTDDSGFERKFNRFEQVLVA